LVYNIKCRRRFILGGDFKNSVGTKIMEKLKLISWRTKETRGCSKGRNLQESLKGMRTPPGMERPQGIR
jgi:hypothetical protein